MNPEQTKKIKELFDKYDENKNGVLEKGEFITGLNELIQSLGDSMPSETVDKISEEAITNFDLDGNGIIECNEFTELIKFLVEEKGLKL